MGTLARRLLTAVALVLTPLSAATAQTPRAVPHPDYMWHDERTVDRFVVQRWVHREMPEVSPAGFCDCITLVYEDGRLVLDLGMDPGITTAQALGDVTGDGRAELVLTRYSGGAHCCESTAIYSMTGERPTVLLSVETGNCPASLVDLDRDGVPELQTCDDRFAYEFCAFAFSPMPPVVYAYDRARATFVLATPRYAPHLRMAAIEEARAAMATAGGDPELRRCAALGPALGLVYTGRMDEGLALFRALYPRPDAADVERKVLELLKTSTHWTAQ